MSEGIRRICAVAGYQVREKLCSRKICITLLVLAAFIYLQEEGIRLFCRDASVSVTPCAFVFLSSDWIAQMVLSAYFVWIMSSFSGRNANDLFMIARAGTKIWKAGTILSILCGAFLYTCLLILISGAVLFPYIDFVDSWGQGWPTLALTTAKTVYAVATDIPAVIMHLHTPPEALLMAGLLQFLLLSWFGLVQYLLNDLCGNAAGSYVCVAFILADVFLANTSLEKLFRFSPVTLSELGNYSAASLKYGYDFAYALRFYLIGIVAFIIAELLIGRKKDLA